MPVIKTTYYVYSTAGQVNSTDTIISGAAYTFSASGGSAA